MTNVYLNYLSLKFFLWIVNIPSIDIESFLVGKCKEGLQKGHFLSLMANKIFTENLLKCCGYTVASIRCFPSFYVYYIKLYHHITEERKKPNFTKA